MPTLHPDVPIIELAGTPRQIGEAHGESQRERIREYAEVHLGWLLRNSAYALSRDELWQRWAPLVAVNEAVAPDLVEEMRGIARAADLPFERVFLINSLLELYNLQFADTSRGLVDCGCSTFGVAEEAGTGQTLIGQTYDLPALHLPFTLLLRVRPNDGPAQLVFTFAGVVGCAGLNEAGLGININYLSAGDTGPGKLHSVIVRKVLGSSTLSDALTGPVAGRRAGGSHYLVADADGHLVSVETTGRQHALLFPDDHGLFYHTNHYLAERLKAVEVIREVSIGGSIARYAVLRRFFQKHTARGLTSERPHDVTRELLMQITRSHTAYPRSICAHGTPTDDPAARGCTVAAMVQSLTERTMWLAAGCPCEGDYHPVPLET